jgi:putative transposase
MLYIETNPIRAGLIENPASYRWSSYLGNALGKPDELLTQHPLYTGLGSTMKDRQLAYGSLFQARLDESVLSEIRIATVSGHLLAGERFRKETEMAKRLVLGPAKRGRPRKTNIEAQAEVQQGIKF